MSLVVSGFVAMRRFYPCLLTSELEALDLSRSRLRKLVEELDPPRILVGRELGLHVLLEGDFQLLISDSVLFENDVSLGLDELRFVLRAHDRSFEHGLVA